jgi:SatD family (SatD)
MKRDNIILMADIIDSSNFDQRQLMQDFTGVVNDININNKEKLLSPLTITLGDEFQGVITGLKEAIAIIFKIEETIINAGKTFKLRYIVVEGAIETPINKEIAYGMMGDGLTRGRKYIENLKKSEYRFYFNLKDNEKQTALNNLFIALQSIIDDWNPERDYYLVSSFLIYKDYKLVASALNKERSLMWKRHKSLKVDTYDALKAVADFIGENKNA